MSAFRIHDRDSLILHRAIRVTLVMPTVFAFGVVVLDQPSLGLFGSFGAFALLGLADFGGEARARTAAYLWLAVAGAILIALGTAASENGLAGAILLAAVAFAITLASVFGGSVAAGGPAALLVFVVAVMVPAPLDGILAREVGWLLACLMAIVVASFVWPVPERLQLRLLAAEVADGLARLLRTPARDDREVQALRDQLNAMRDRYGTSGARPAGPTRRVQALVRLLDQLQRAVSFSTRMPLPAPWPGERSAADREGDVDDPALARAVERTFVRTAAVLRGTAPPTVGDELEPIRTRHRTSLEAWLGSALRSGQDPAAIATRLGGTFGIRVLSHTALSCESDAVLAVGGTLPDDASDLLLDTPSDGGVAATVTRAWHLVRPHLHPGSVTFRNALRAAVALSAALVVAGLVHAEHGFWVVLGTLTVLKSSAMRTGLTALQVLLGNLLGFVIAGVAMVAFGDNVTALWIALPIAVFLTIYAPAAIHFVLGQASFTVLVVVLFNIIEPEGWRTGLVRVESVAIGAAISLVIGVVFWPRGNRRALHAAAAAFYRSVAAYLDAAFGALIQPSRDTEDPTAPDAVRATRMRARDAELTSDAALFDLLAAPTSVGAPVPAWAQVTSIGRSLRLVGDGLRAIPARGYEPLLDGPDRQELASLAATRVAVVADLADAIGGGAPVAAVAPAPAPLAAWLGRVAADDDAAISRALAMVWSVEWIGYVDTLVGLDAESIESVRATAGTPWWR